MSKHICDSEFDWCPSDARSGDFYKLRVKNLSPTQFAIGKAEVAVRAGRFRKKYIDDSGKLHDYLRTRPIPIIIRKKNYYLVDHHHLTRALFDALHTELGRDVCVFVKVLANFSTLERTYFWKTMHAHNWVYLFECNGGGPQQPEALPTSIKDLKFDPYRSLAWIVREHHGYIKNNVPFSEFKWANFFRTRILLDQDILAGKHTFDDFAFEVDVHGRLDSATTARRLSRKRSSWQPALRRGACRGFIGSIS